MLSLFRLTPSFESVGGLLQRLVIRTNSLVNDREFSNCHRASITKTKRLQYLLSYPTVVVNPDGSTFTVRHSTPRKIIKLPIDITQLSESSRNARLERRKLKTKVKLDEEFEDESFDAKKYLKFVKK